MKPYLNNCEIFRSPKFGGIALGISLKDFNDMGFNYGDSLDFYFSNGESMTDIPYYNNYYSAVDEPLLCGFPTFSEARLAYNMTRDAWYFHHLTDECTVNISVHEPGKYLNIQKSMNLNASNNREDYPDDATFGNFRAVNIGKLKPDTLYRAASPCDLEHNRNTYVDRLMQEAGVQFLLSLADSSEELKEFYEDPDVMSPHFKLLYEKGLICPVNIAVNYRTEEYQSRLGTGLKILAAHEGPYMIYCSLGKDRTGFLVTLLAALLGASYPELEEEYMKTYKNFYGIDKNVDAERYDNTLKILFFDMIKLLTGKKPSELAEDDLRRGAEEYLSSCGLNSDDIEKLKHRLSAENA